MNIKRATHIARHNVCRQVRMEKAVPTPEGTGNPRLKFWEIVLTALEKQRARKPIKDREQNIRYTSAYSCPVCGGGFTGTGIADYCYHCGQKLDWEE